MRRILFLFGILIFWNLQWGIAKSECEVLEEIEAVDDFGSTISGEPVTINVLKNDKGDSLHLKSIIYPPDCGEIVDWQENGTVVYVADTNTNCGFDTFIYEIENATGEKAQATVTILIIDPTPKLEVQYDWNPCGAQIEDFYYVNVFVNGNRPPFHIDVNGMKDTLTESGIVFFQIEIGGLFEIYVVDSIGQEFYAIGGETNCWGYIPCDGEPNEKPTFNCIGGGKVSVEISEEFLQNAYWMDLSGVSHSLKQIDTIPDLSYVFIPRLGKYDTLVNCLSANDDFVEALLGETLSFNVLENDFGQKVQVSNILQLPTCGELIAWSADGAVTYKASEDESCFEDSMVYEVENELGEKASAMVEFGENPNENMYLEWNLECEEWECYLEVIIKGGVAPYIVAGYLNEVIEENHFTVQVFCGEDFQIQVTDSNEEIDAIQSNTNVECSGDYDYCYEPEYMNQYLEIKCLGEMGGIVNYLLRMNFATVKNAFYITSNNEYYTFTESDTLPNHSYYYLDLKYLGHIDGYINCLTTDIEETNIAPSNSFLQLYPNPNQGQFSLQVQTSKPSLQSYPIQVYNTAGQSIWKGTLQNNRLKALDLGNIGSGLYVLQVVTEGEVLMERFWVE